MATKKKKSVGFAMMEPKDANEIINNESSQFQHKHTKTAHALEVLFTLFLF